LKTLVTCNFKTNEELTASQIVNTLLSLEFTRENGFGVRNVESEDDIIKARLIKINYSYIFDYNDTTKEIEKRQISIISEIDFLIDFNQALICIIGAISNVAPVKLFFKNTFKDQVLVTPFAQTIPEICDKLLAKKIKFKFLSIAVENFNYMDGVVGKFSGTVLDNQVVQDLVDKYKTDIQRIGISIYLSEYVEPIEIVVASMGLLKINAEENEVNEVFNDLKTLLYI
jgi:hypothetical protein